jgi:hypothetical protein
MTTESYIKYYVKIANTDTAFSRFYLDSLTVEEFIYELQCVGANEFNVEYDMVEVVEAGQEIDNVKPENAPKLEPEYITMVQKYGGRLKQGYMAFYLRKAQ